MRLSTLIEAVKNNNSDIQDIIQQTGDINTVDINGYSALRYAIKNRNWEIVDILLENKALVEFDELYEVFVNVYADLMQMFNGAMQYPIIIRKLLERAGSEKIIALMANPEVKFILLQCCLNHHAIFDLICKSTNTNSKDFTAFFKIKDVDNPNHKVRLAPGMNAIPIGNGILLYRLGRLFPFNIYTKIFNVHIYLYQSAGYMLIKSIDFCLMPCCQPRDVSPPFEMIFKTGFDKALASLEADEIWSLIENMDPQILVRTTSHINFNRIIHQNEAIEPVDREAIKDHFSRIYLYISQPGISIERYKEAFIQFIRCAIPKYVLNPKDAKDWFDLLDNSLPWIKKDDHTTRDKILRLMLELSCKFDINHKNIYQAWNTYAKITVYRRQPLTKMIYAYMKKGFPVDPRLITKHDAWLKLFARIDDLLTDYDHSAKDQLLIFRAKLFLTNDPRQSFEYALQIKSALNLDTADNLLVSDILYADSRSKLNGSIGIRASSHLSQAAISGDGAAKDRLKDRSQPFMKNTSGFELDIIYPRESKDNQEFDQKLNAWKREHKPNDILFIYCTQQSAWEAYLIQKDNTEPKKVLIAKSPFVEFAQELKHIDSESSLFTYDKRKLRSLLIKYPLFSDAKLYRSPLSMTSVVSSVEEKKKSQTHRADEKAKSAKCDKTYVKRFKDHKDIREGGWLTSNDSNQLYERLIALDEDEMPSVELSIIDSMPESTSPQSQFNSHNFFECEAKEMMIEAKDSVSGVEISTGKSTHALESLPNSCHPFNFFSAEEKELMLKVKNTMPIDQVMDECKSQPADVDKSKKLEPIEEVRLLEVRKILEKHLKIIREHLIKRFQATTDIDSWVKVARSTLKFFKLAYTDADYACRKNYYVRLEQIYQQSKLPVMAESENPADTIVDGIVIVLNEALHDQRIVGDLTSVFSKSFANLLIGMLRELNQLSKQLPLRPEFYQTEPYQAAGHAHGHV